METILISHDYPFLKNRLFDISDKNWNYDNRFVPFYELKKALLSLGYELKTIDMGNPLEAKYIIFSDIPPQWAKHYLPYKWCVEHGLQKKMLLWLWESPVVLPDTWNLSLHSNFAKIFTWNDDLVDNRKYYKMFYPQPVLEESDFIPFSKRKLCTLIAKNQIYRHPLELYTERITAIRSFERLCPYDFDLFGKGWNQPKNSVEQKMPFLMPRFPSYRGAVNSKSTTLANYKFCFCYENAIGVEGFSGYISEKIHHCFMSNCVPIYLGANNIEQFIPPNTFIDRRNFNSYEQLYSFLMQITEAEYMPYIKNIQNYLCSKSFYDTFSVNAFVNLMVKHLVD